MSSERYTITTPENVEFEFEIAGFFSRFVAWLTDIAIILLLLMGFGSITNVLGLVGEGFAQALMAVGYFVINWGYFVLTEWRFGGQSLGKRVVGLRVLSDDGVRISLFQSAVRNLLRVLDNLPVTYLLGGSVALLSHDGKRIGDKVAGTIVVRERARPMPEVIVPEKERYNSFISDRKVVRSVASRLSLADREFLIDLALRREQLSLGQRLRLFSGAADYLSERIGVERPEHFSDEKFCLNITAILLRGSEEALDDEPWFVQPGRA